MLVLRWKNPLMYAFRKARVVHDPLKRLEGVWHPLGSIEGVEPNPLGHFEWVKFRAAS